LIVFEAAPFAATLACAGGGLLAIYLRLGREFDRSTSLLTVLLTATATPLWHALANPSFIDVAVFAGLAIIANVPARDRFRDWRGAGVIVAVLLVPLITPDVTSTPTLFTAGNGFLALTPVTYIAVIGMVIGARRWPLELIALLLALAVWPLLNTALVPAAALLAPGLAVLIDFARRRPFVAVAPLVLGAVLWNYWLMVQYTAGTVPKDAPISFAAMVRQQADVHTREPYVYPFAFPGNLLAAWREGIPLSRYDLLSGEPLSDRFEVRFDSAGDRFLLDGWGPRGSTSVGAFRPVIGRQASIVMPIQTDARGLEITILISSREAAAGATPTTMRVEINDQHVGDISINTATPTPSEARVHLRAEDVGRIIRAGYNRLTLVPSEPNRVAVYRVRLAPAA
jgi:hypothetical protein